jgi:hypothetical protein
MQSLLPPSHQPSSQPTWQPSVQPSSQPLGEPSWQPSMQPSMQPSVHPSVLPTQQPFAHPSSRPTMSPSTQPSTQPVSCPTSQPSSHPSRQPSQQPVRSPTCQPTAQPTSQPTAVRVGNTHDSIALGSLNSVPWRMWVGLVLGFVVFCCCLASTGFVWYWYPLIAERAKKQRLGRRQMPMYSNPMRHQVGGEEMAKEASDGIIETLAVSLLGPIVGLPSENDVPPPPSSQYEPASVITRLEPTFVRPQRELAAAPPPVPLPPPPLVAFPSVSMGGLRTEHAPSVATSATAVERRNLFGFLSDVFAGTEAKEASPPPAASPTKQGNAPGVVSYEDAYPDEETGWAQPRRQFSRRPKEDDASSLFGLGDVDDFDFRRVMRVWRNRTTTNPQAVPVPRAPVPSPPKPKAKESTRRRSIVDILFGTNVPPSTEGVQMSKVAGNSAGVTRFPPPDVPSPAPPDVHASPRPARRVSVSPPRTLSPAPSMSRVPSSMHRPVPPSPMRSSPSMERSPTMRRSPSSHLSPTKDNPLARKSSMVLSSEGKTHRNPHKTSVYDNSIPLNY